jgi:hypothetical protein
VNINLTKHHIALGKNRDSTMDHSIIVYITATQIESKKRALSGVHIAMPPQLIKADPNHKQFV